MSGMGPAPKDPSKRRRRNADPISARSLARDNIVRGPELPPGGWHVRTIEWWEMWRNSPQAIEFTDSDWSFLLDTAILHNLLWQNSTDEKVVSKVSSELRLRVAKFGATPEDRARLRMQFAEKDSETETTKTSGAYAHLRRIQ